MTDQRLERQILEEFQEFYGPAQRQENFCWTKTRKFLLDKDKKILWTCLKFSLENNFQII